MSASRSFDHGRTRRNFAFTDEVVDLGEEPFDALEVIAQAEIAAREEFIDLCADAADGTRWARSVDYC